MQTTTYKLNVTPGGVPLTIHISQYDVGLRQYIFQPYTSEGEFTYVSGATVTLEATKPDGYAVIHNCTYNQDGSIAYTVQEQLAAKAGRVWSKVVIRNGNNVLGTGAVLWIVDYAGVKDNAIISDSDISGLEGYVDQMKTLVGTPIAVTTAAGMTDHEKLYLYEGSESGYTAGDWYYWNGSAWTSGGEYGSGAVEVDPTLSIAGEAADAKATGDGLAELKNELTGVTDDILDLTIDKSNLLLYVPVTSFDYSTTTPTYKQNVIGEFSVTPGKSYTFYRGSVTGELLENDIIYSQFNGDTKINDVQIPKTTKFAKVVAASNATKVQIRQLVTLASRPASSGTMVTRIVMAVEGDFESTDDIKSHLDSSVNALNETVYGTPSIIPAYERSSGYVTTTAVSIYKSDKLKIEAGKELVSVKYDEGNSEESKVLWVIDANNVILDKIAYTPTGTGINTISVGRSYPVDAYIGISGKGLKIQSVGTTEPSAYYSLGVWESYGITYGIGQTLSFLHSATTNYYEFIVEITVQTVGLTDRVERIENSDAFITLDIGGMTIPRLTNSSEDMCFYGRWFDKEINGTTYKCTNTDGASIAIHVSGTTTLSVTFGTITTPTYTPYFAYSIDGGAFTRQLITNTSITLPDTNEHFVWIVVDGMGEIDPSGSSKWSGTIGVYLQSITGGTSNGINFRARQIYFVGDSIVEGVNVLGTGANASVNSAVNAFSFKTARKLNSIPLLCGYGGTGVLIDSSFHKAIEAIEYNANGIKVNSMIPDIVVIEYGANDGASILAGTHTEAEFITAYKALIEAIHIKYGTPIICLVPFGLWLKDAIIDCASEYSYCYAVDTTNWGITTTDDTHPDAVGATTAAEKLADEISSIFGKTYFA